jgi:hypothetical protein
VPAVFKQQTVKAFSIVSIVLSVIGLLISVTRTVLLKRTEHTLAFFMGCQYNTQRGKYHASCQDLGLRVRQIQS